MVASKFTLDEAKALAEEHRAAGKYSLRSCYECNKAHLHLHDEAEPLLFCCAMGCGGYFFGMWNLSAERQVCP